MKSPGFDAEMSNLLATSGLLPFSVTTAPPFQLASSAMFRSELALTTTRALFALPTLLTFAHLSEAAFPNLHSELL